MYKLIYITTTNEKEAKKITETLIKELHSYEVPCIISLSIEKGYPKFLKWIDEKII